MRRGRPPEARRRDDEPDDARDRLFRGRGGRQGACDGGARRPRLHRRSGRQPDGVLRRHPRQSDQEILRLARKAVAAEPFVNLDGSGATNGKAVEVHLSYASEAGRGYVAKGEQEILILRHGDDLWVKASEAVWRQQLADQADEFVGAVGGRWIAVGGVEELALLARFVSAGYVTRQLLSPSGTPSLGREVKVNGDACLVVVVAAGELCVRKQDARPMQMLQRGDLAVPLNFSYDRRAIELAPAEKDALDATDLGFPTNAPA